MENCMNRDIPSNFSKITLNPQNVTLVAAVGIAMVAAVGRDAKTLQKVPSWYDDIA